jgi:hypothetical protein
MPLCPYCNKEWAKKKHRKKCGCLKSEQARKALNAERQREWYARNIGKRRSYAAMNKAKDEAIIPIKLYPCQHRGCRKMSVNRLWCNEHHAILARSYYGDCMGYPLPEGFN